MALTKAQLREILSGAGADPEKIPDAVNKIIEGHTASIEALREERDTYKAKAETADALQKEVDDLKAKDSTEELEKVRKEYDELKVKVETEKTHAAKETAFRKILKKIGIPENHHDRIVKYSDVDGQELDDKGEIKNAKELENSLKEEWGDHIPTNNVTGAHTPTPPTGVGSGSGMTKEEIMKIKDTATRQAALRDFLQGKT
jgi:dsDNA-specific endonuclease/ATPase MutS2